MIVFFPSIQEWITQGGASWYRPFQVWLAVIIIIYFIDKESQQDEL